jgi:hypothetical protein
MNVRSRNAKKRLCRWQIAAALVLGCVGVSSPERASAEPLQPPIYFPASVLSQPIPANAPLDARSNQMVQELRNQAFGVAHDVAFNCRRSVNLELKWWSPEELRWCHQMNYRADIQQDSYAPPVYTVGAAQPPVAVKLDAYAPDLSAAVSAVPIPTNAIPAPGTDGQMIIWQPSSDTMWEFWRARSLSDGWHAGWGGRIQNVSTSPGHYRDILNTNRLCAGPTVTWCERHIWGGPSARIPNLVGLMTIAQLESGHVDHALTIALPNNLQNAWSWPAQGTDGPGNSIIPQGARFRVDPNLDLNAWFASLKNPDGSQRPIPPILRMITVAAQRYGLVVVNTGGSVSFYAENWRPSGNNVYDGPGGLFGGLRSWQFTVDFPWEHLQALNRRMCTAPQVGVSATPCDPPTAVTVQANPPRPCAPPVAVTPQAGDETGPSVAITNPANGTAASGLMTFSAAARDPSGVAKVEFFVDGTRRYVSNYPHCALSRMQYTYGGMHGFWDTRSETTGSHVLEVRATDTRGNQRKARVSVTIAGGISTNALTVPVLTRPSTIFQTRTSFVSTWQSNSDGAGVAGYDVNFRRASFREDFGSTVRWLSATAATHAVFESASPGSTYCIAARARDSADRASAWSSERCAAIPIDDRDLSIARGPWARTNAKGYFLGTYSLASRRGAKLVLPGIVATRLVLVATRCPRCGIVRVLWNGASLRKLDLSARATRRKVRFRLAHFSAPKTGKLVIKVVSRGKPVKIDGLGASLM